MNQLTKKETKILDYIKRFIALEQTIPTQKNIAKHFGISQQMVSKYINILKKKKVLKTKDNKIVPASIVV